MLRPSPNHGKLRLPNDDGDDNDDDDDDDESEESNQVYLVTSDVTEDIL